jgi:AcrR family transcriptional regulator
VTSSTGRRDRKKQRTRTAIANAAQRLFEREGFAATTVQAICDEADVALSTFYAHFDSKHAAALPDDDRRADAVAAMLDQRPADEPLHVTLRRASSALVAWDLQARADHGTRFTLIATEPEVAAYVSRRQAIQTLRFAQILAGQLGIDAAQDKRPEMIVASLFAALGSAWAAWIDDPSRDLSELVATAHDVLDDGLIAAMDTL